jgi:hypothetical protein
MPRNRRTKSHRDIAAYLNDDRLPAGERGAVVLGLWAHAVAFLLLTTAQMTWCGVTAVRVWRRRDAGWVTALRTGVHRPTLAGLVAATVAYAGLRGLGMARLGRRAREHAAPQAQDPST